MFSPYNYNFFLLTPIIFSYLIVVVNMINSFLDMFNQENTQCKDIIVYLCIST